MRKKTRTRGAELEYLSSDPRSIVTPEGVLVDVAPMRATVAALRASEELNRAVVATLAEGIVVLGAEREALMWNESAARLLEGRPEVVGELLDADGHRTQVRHAGRWLVINQRPLGAGGGRVCSIEDVSERVDGEQRLREERDRAQRYLDIASTLIVVLDADGRVQLINRKGCELLGRGEDDLVGQDWFAAVVPVADREAAREVFDRIVDLPATHEERFETTVVGRDGDPRVIRWHSTLLTDAVGAPTGVLRSGEDVTDTRRAEAEVRYLAYHDRLTGLANRTLLEEHLGLAVARARRNGTSIALLCLDLDGFGLVNDSLGHAAGDEVLRQVAQRLRGTTRANDLLARPGGDEFVLMLSDVEDAAAETATVVSRLVGDALDEPFRVDDAEFRLTASIGISLLPEHADNAGDLLRRADVAMEQAKRRGSGPAFFTPSRVDPRTRLSLSARLRRALDRDEFVLHFQPVCSPADGRLVAAEALIRWNDPEHGLVGPGAFIPAAEETGVIEAIGAWVLDAVCAQAHAWSREHASLPRLSFNLSPRELRRVDLVPSIIERVAAYGLDPSGFCIELTESSAMAQPQRTLPMLGDLSEAGFALAIDDFGAGHSSLARLRELPVQLLKIDRSFLSRVPADAEASAIVAAILTLGRALGMTAVAEGVETPEQLDFLVRHDCPLAQGYLLGRPVPAAQLGELLRGRSAA